MNVKKLIERLIDISAEHPEAWAPDVVLRAGDRWLRDVEAIDKVAASDGRIRIVLVAGDGRIPDSVDRERARLYPHPR